MKKPLNVVVVERDENTRDRYRKVFNRVSNRVSS